MNCLFVERKGSTVRYFNFWYFIVLFSQVYCILRQSDANSIRPFKTVLQARLPDIRGCAHRVQISDAEIQAATLESTCNLQVAWLNLLFGQSQSRFNLAKQFF